MNKNPKKLRADQALLAKGLVFTIKEAVAQIMLGHCLYDEQKILHPGTLIKSLDKLRLKGEKKKFVSRGGEKLFSLLVKEELTSEFKDQIVYDIGSSTGGFTDCVLKLGAGQVFCIDVGTNQLAWELRQDKRIVVCEKTDIKNFAPRDPRPDWILADISFTSLARLVPYITKIAHAQTRYLMLIKPQFELSKEMIPDGGIVTDPRLHEKAIEQVTAELARYGVAVRKVIASPVLGTFGNQEFFVLC